MYERKLVYQLSKLACDPINTTISIINNYYTYTYCDRVAQHVDNSIMKEIFPLRWQILELCLWMKLMNCIKLPELNRDIRSASSLLIIYSKYMTLLRIIHLKTIP